MIYLLGLPVTPGSRATWDAQLLKIPAVSPSIINCCVIKVDYYVKVTPAKLHYCIPTYNIHNCLM